MLRAALLMLQAVAAWGSFARIWRPAVWAHVLQDAGKQHVGRKQSGTPSIDWGGREMKRMSQLVRA